MKDFLDKHTMYGYYSLEDNTIHVNLMNPDGKFYSIEELLETLVHEVCHLKHFDHTKDFNKLCYKTQGWFFEKYVY